MTLNQITKVKGPGIHTQANIVSNSISLGGIATASNFKTGTTNVHNVGVEAAGINVLGADTPIGTGATIYDAGGAVFTGVVTATSFSGTLTGNVAGDATGLTGTPDITVRNITGVGATFTGNVSIGGTLTYEDVTNVDSVGLVTARTGVVSPYADIDDWIDVGSNIKLGNAGVITATSFSGSGANLTGIDATALKDSGGNVKIQAQASGAMHTGVSTITQKLVVGSGNNINSTALINTGDVDIDALTLSNWDGSTTTNKVTIHFDSSGRGGWNIGMPAATDAFVIEDDGGTEKLRITGGGHIVTQGLSDYSFNNDSSNAKILEVTGDGTVGEYGVVTISSNQNADSTNVGTLRFVNRENSHSSSGNNAGSKQVAAIQAYLKTSDSNAGDDSGGFLSFFTKNEAAVNAEALRITQAQTVNIGANFTQTTYKAQITTGTNKHISFGNAAHNDLSNEGSGIFFSRQNNGSPELSGLFAHSNGGFGIATREYLTFHTGGGSTYGAAPERMRIKSDGHITLPCTNNALGFELNPGTGAGSLVLDQNSSITSNIRASDGGSNVGGGSGGGSRIRLGKNQLHFDTFPYVTSAGDSVTYTPRLSILSTGTEVLGDLYVKTTYPRIYLLDTDNNSDYSIINSNGNFSIYDDTNSAWRLRITNDGKIHTGNPAADASDDFNITALGTGATLSLCRASTGNASNGDLLGSIAFQSYPSGQSHTAAEAAIKAYAESGQSGSAAPTSLHFYTKPSSVGPGGSASQRMVIASDGEVFIGGNAQVTDRSTLLSISGPNQDPGGVWSQVGIYSEDSYAQNKGGSIGFGGQDGTTTKQQFAAISGVKENGTSGNYAGMMRFWTRPGNAVTQERMRIQSDGTTRINAYLGVNVPFGESVPQALTVRNGGIYLEQGNSITWNNGDNSIKGESGYHLLFSTYDGSNNTQKMRIRGGSGNGGAKIELVRSNGGFYHQTASAAITPANGDWVYFGYVPYGASKRGKFTVEWASLQAPSCCYHGYTTLSAGSAYGPLYDYTHSESIEIINYDSHGAHNFKAWKMVDHGNYLKVFGQWSGSTVQSGTFRVTSLPTELYDGSSFVVATPAVDNNSYDGTRLTIDGRFQANVPGYSPDQLRLNKSMFGIFHATSGLDTAGAVTTRGTATGANGTIWCNYGGISPTRNGYAVGSYTPFAGMVAGCGTGARYLHVKFNITSGSMWMIDIKGYEYNGHWTSSDGSSTSTDKIHHSISGGYHYNNNALFNGKSSAYRGIAPGWYLHGGYICCYIDTNNTGTSNRWGFYKFEGGTDGIIGTGNQKPSCVIGWTFSTNTNSAF